MRVLTSNLLSDRAYVIEFQGYLSNHVKHALIALEGMNAPPAVVQRYWDNYTSNTPYNLQLEKVPRAWEDVKPVTSESWRSLRGKKEQWQEMCVYIQQQHGRKTMAQLVKEYVPDLVGGLAGSLAHGIILLGWSLDQGGSDWMTIEGLAYLNFCYLGVDESKLKIDAIPIENEGTPMESLARVSETFHSKNLAETWIKEVKIKYDSQKVTFYPFLVVAGFQWELAKVLNEPHDVAIQLPAWITLMPVDEVWEYLYEACTYLYLATIDGDHGSFLVLHLLTSLWGLEHVCRVVDDPAFTRRAFRHYYACLVCILSTSSVGIPSVEALQKVQEEYPSRVVRGSCKEGDEDYDWNSVFGRAFLEIEEHNIKLPYVCRELWKRYGHWNGYAEAAKHFTVTPNIGPKSVEYKA